MSFFPHIVVGAVTGSFIPNPWGAALGGGVSHFVLDYIPHWDPVVNGKVPKGKLGLYGLLLLIDILLSVIVLILVSPFPNMFWGGVAAGLVDIDNFLQYLPTKQKIFPLLSKLGLTAHEAGSKWHNMTNIHLGLFNQTWVTLLGLIVLYLRLYH